jgi:RNA recognition motif-containing protein
MIFHFIFMFDLQLKACLALSREKTDEVKKSNTSPDITQRKIFVVGIDDSVTSVEFRAAFAKYGSIEDAFLIGDGTRRRGFGFVVFGMFHGGLFYHYCANFSQLGIIRQGRISQGCYR